jgi:hypothetical protein
VIDPKSKPQNVLVLHQDVAENHAMNMALGALTERLIGDPESALAIVRAIMAGTVPGVVWVRSMESATTPLKEDADRLAAALREYYAFQEGDRPHKNSVYVSLREIDQAQHRRANEGALAALRMHGEKKP